MGQSNISANLHSSKQPEKIRGSGVAPLNNSESY